MQLCTLTSMDMKCFFWPKKSYFPAHERPLSLQEGVWDWLSQEELPDIFAPLHCCLFPCLPLYFRLLSQKLADVSSNDSSDSLETRFLSILCTRSYPHLRRGRTTFLSHCWTLSCNTSAWIWAGWDSWAAGGWGGPISPVVGGDGIWGGWLRSPKPALVPSGPEVSMVQAPGLLGAWGWDGAAQQ